MKLTGEAQLLRVFIGESDQWEGRPLTCPPKTEPVRMRVAEPAAA